MRLAKKLFCLFIYYASHFHKIANGSQRAGKLIVVGGIVITSFRLRFMTGYLLLFFFLLQPNRSIVLPADTQGWNNPASKVPEREWRDGDY